MRLEADIVVPALDLKSSIEKTLNAEVYPYFNRWARGIAKLEVAERPNQEYTVQTDGVLVDGIDGIQNARKEVVVVWLRSAVRLAIQEYANILRRTAEDKAASADYWTADKRNSIPSGVVVFYGGEGKPTRQIHSVNDVESFDAGDFIMVTSSSPWQQYLNTMGRAKGSKRVHPLKRDLANHKGGYFGLAAKRIRRLLNADKKNASALWVGAVRSKSVLKAIGQPPLKTLEGRINWAKLQEWGAWAIMIRYSKRVPQGAIQNGRQ